MVNTAQYFEISARLYMKARSDNKVFLVERQLDFDRPEASWPYDAETDMPVEISNEEAQRIIQIFQSL